MELRKENIHRLGRAQELAAGKTETTFTLDGDINVPDSKPDVRVVVREAGSIAVLEKKHTGGRLHIRGNLTAFVLYLAEDGSGMYGLETVIPFDEMIHTGQEDCADISVRAELEDLSATLIHSRKINVKALVRVSMVCEEVVDEIVVTELEGKGFFASAKDVSFTNLAAIKKDTVRVKEEVMLPNSKPNIGSMIYKEMQIVLTESRVMDEELLVKGTADLFLVYRSSDSKGTAEFFEAKVPFQESFALSGAHSGMIEDISYHVIQETIETKPDDDGEERIITMEAVLELDMKLYEEKELVVLEDIYSANGEVELRGCQEKIPHLLMKNQGMGSFMGTHVFGELAATPMQITHGTAKVHLEKVTPEEGGLKLEGMLEFKLLMVTGSDERPYIGMKFYEPFEHQLGVNGLDESCTYKVTPFVTDSAFQLYRSNEVEWKTEVNFQTMVFGNDSEYMLVDAEFIPFAEEEKKNRCNVIGYRSEEGDTLWSVGKKFHISPEEVAEYNDLEDEVIPAKKMLLLVRSSIPEEE